MRQEQLAETTAVLQGRVGDRKAWVSAVLAANWGAAARARAALHTALPDSMRGREDPDAALYAKPQVLVHTAPRLIGPRTGRCPHHSQLRHVAGAVLVYIHTMVAHTTCRLLHAQ